MTLGMAKEKFATDPEAARALVDEGHQEAKQALATLRNIVRGISPAILSDRGLGAALSSVAARSTVPVALEVNLPHRLDPGVEGIAYYVVCEALANVARHPWRPEFRFERSERGEVLEIEASDMGGEAPLRREAPALQVSPTELRRLTGDSRSRVHRVAPPCSAPKFPAVRRGDEVRIALAEDSVLLRAGLSAPSAMPAKTWSPKRAMASV